MDEPDVRDVALEKALNAKQVPLPKEEKKEVRGFHNWKNLFRKPTMQDWLILILLIMSVGGLLYGHYTAININNYYHDYMNKSCTCIEPTIPQQNILKDVPIPQETEAVWKKEAG